MNVGDIVRVTNSEYPDAAIEGTVSSIVKHEFWTEVTVRGIWNYLTTVSTVYFDVEVIRRVEPEAIGSTITIDNTTYTKYTNHATIEQRWISHNGMKHTWSAIVTKQ